MFNNLKTKYLFLLLFLVVCFIAALLLIPDTPKPESIPIFQNPSWRARSEEISPRNAQIENYHNFPEKFPSEQFDDKIFHLVVYPQSNRYHKVQNFEGQRDEGRPGMIVFNDKKIILEVSTFAEINQDSVSFQHLTGMAALEIVAVDSGGGNATQCGMSVYKWDGTKFVLITPQPDEYINPCEGSNPADGGAKDIDGDGVFELITFRMTRVNPEADLDDPLFDEMSETVLIYKFNGTKYYLWKEVAESSPEFKELFE